MKVITEREKEREKGRRERGRERGEKERENKVMMNVSLKFKSANIVYFRLVLCIELYLKQCDHLTDWPFPECFSTAIFKVL